MPRARLPDWRSWGGPLLTLLALGIVEVCSRGPLALPNPFPSTLMLLVLGTLGVSALLGGLRSGLGSVALYGLYAPRFLADSGRMLDLTPFGMMGTGIMIGIGLAVALPAAFLKQREDRLHLTALATQRRLTEVEQERVRALEERNRLLRETNETLDAFSYVISHDLKEPVRALSMSSQILMEDHGDELRPEARELAQRTVDASTRLARLVDGLLEFSRATRFMTEEATGVTVAGLLSETDCVARYGDMLTERDVCLEVQNGPPFIAVVAPACQIMGNLVLNAIKHNDHPTPEVRVSARRYAPDPQMVQIVVEDNGPGFPTRLMLQFARLHPDRPAMISGGFGLLIARRAAERLGGRMWVDRSEDLGGAAVHVTLPAAPSEQEWSVSG